MLATYALALLPLLAALPDPQAASVLVEAERFDQPGGWLIDAQFRMQMGSTYLLAAGIGTPVADATTTVKLPRAGTYRLFVRCKDWDRTSPGAFQVLVGGRASEVRFGTQRQGWAWIAGGAFELPAGAVTVALHDLTGYYGRCDAVLLTTDANYTPSNDAAAVVALRQQLLPPPAPVTSQWDLVVVGGGYGGVCTALQAARLGLKTVLVQNRPVLGGNASDEIRVGPGGASPHTSRFRETGLCEEIAEGRVRPSMKGFSGAIDLLVAAESNLTVLLNTEGQRAVMDGQRRIAAVEAENVIDGRRYVLRAPLFADCTGDGHLAFTAGAAFRVGQEARAEYHESYAPEQANPHTMGTSILHGSKPMDTPQRYAPPAFAVRFTKEHFQHRTETMLHGNWWVEYGGLRDTIGDAEEIRDELLRVVFGAFDYAKNHDRANRDRAANYRLTHVPTVGGKRESRRFMGDVVLTQNDLETARLWPDRVAWGGWSIDLHPSPGIYGKEIPPFTPYALKQPYSIPYRILFPKGLDNLFMAGRHVSVTHVALGSTRLMQTIGTMGQACGAAAFLCRKYACDPRGLYPERIGELQQLLLKWDAYLPQVSNEDPGDLCRGAKATASSTAPVSVSVYGAEPPWTKDAPLTMARAQTIVAAKAGVTAVQVLLANRGEQEQTATVHLEQGPLGADGNKPLWQVEAKVKPGAFRWIEFKLPEALPVMKPYLLWVAPSPGLVMKIAEDADGERAWGKPGAWTHSHGLYAIRPLSRFQELGNVGPSAAVDGLKWPLAGEGHQWRSDATQGLPQWLEIDLGRQVALNTVYLTFDTNIYGRFATARPGAEVTAQDYRLLYRVGNDWRQACSEQGNRRRFRRHRFATVTTDRLRLEITAARNGQEARVYEIRAYHE